MGQWEILMCDIYIYIEIETKKENQTKYRTK